MVEIDKELESDIKDATRKFSSVIGQGRLLHDVVMELLVFKHLSSGLLEQIAQNDEATKEMLDAIDNEKFASLLKEVVATHTILIPDKYGGSMW